MQQPEDVDQEVVEKVKENMPKFHQWRQEKLEEVPDELREEAEEVADEVRTEGFWVEAQSVLDLYLIHGLSPEKVKEDMKSAIQEALGGDQDG